MFVELLRKCVNCREAYVAKR